MRKWGYIAFLSFLAFPAMGQQLMIFENDLQWRYEEELNKRNVYFHTDVKPYFQAEIDSLYMVDTVETFDWISDTTTKNVDAGGKNLRLQVLFDLQGGVDVADTSGLPLKWTAGGGLMLGSQLRKDLYVEGTYVYRYQAVPDYLAALAERRYMLPGQGFTKTGKDAYQTHSFSGYASYTPDKHFNFQLGQGRTFFGDGYRSMFMSDGQYAYPYLKVTSTFWRFRYVNQYAMMQNIAESGGERSGFQTKFSTTHYLSYNVNDMLSLSFFETVIWHGRDNNLNRGFDVSYLNPIILFRPVEFNAGSADNALLGMGYKIKVTDKAQIYGQLTLDEFLFAHIKEDWKQFINPKDSLKSGWWANKFAIQFGVKTFDLFKIEGLSLQSEINWVRPFTYSHGTVTQSWSHMGEPLAHPLGANFYEWVNIVRFKQRSLLVEGQINHVIHGSNPAAVSNYGGDIFIPYGNRVREFENFTGQGIQRQGIFTRLRGSWLLDKASNLRAEAGIIYRRDKNDFGTHNTAYFTIGLRSAIHNRYTDY